jgi:hypothetical protein
MDLFAERRRMWRAVSNPRDWLADSSLRFLVCVPSCAMVFLPKEVFAIAL